MIVSSLYSPSRDVFLRAHLRYYEDQDVNFAVLCAKKYEYARSGVSRLASYFLMSNNILTSIPIINILRQTQLAETNYSLIELSRTKEVLVKIML